FYDIKRKEFLPHFGFYLRNLRNTVFSFHIVPIIIQFLHTSLDRPISRGEKCNFITIKNVLHLCIVNHFDQIFKQIRTRFQKMHYRTIVVWVGRTTIIEIALILTGYNTYLADKRQQYDL